MVNIHISHETKQDFKSKNAILKLKKFLKETPDVGLVTGSEYLKEGLDFEFKEEEDNIYVSTKKEEHIWGNAIKQQAETKAQMPEEDSRAKLRRRLKELRDIRNGVQYREMNQMKKSVDKSIFQRYAWLRQHIPNLPLPKPNELLDDPDKHKEEIEMFASGMIKMSGDNRIDQAVSEYFKLVADKVGFTPLSKAEVEQKMQRAQQEMQSQMQGQAQPKPPPQDFELPSNINLSNYVDSDTESDSSDDEEKKE